jgi:CBS domain-containing protein
MHSLVRDVMTTEVATVEPSTPFKEIVARRLQAAGVKRLPVVDRGAGWSGSSAAPISSRCSTGPTTTSGGRSWTR